jgi:hypothetical protein
MPFGPRLLRKGQDHVTRRLVFPVVLVSCLAGCVNIPDTYAPPVDRRPVTGASPNLFGSIVSMNDASAPQHIIKDISPLLENGLWRWTGKRPELRFVVSRVSDVTLAVDFAIPKLTFDQTGPVCLSFMVNDRLLEQVRYDTPGNKKFEKPVPAGWLHLDRMNTVAAEVDKVYVSPKDGAMLGFILSRAGFVE